MKNCAIMFTLITTLIFQNVFGSISSVCKVNWQKTMAWNPGEHATKVSIESQNDDAINRCAVDAQSAMLRDCVWDEGNGWWGAGWVVKNAGSGNWCSSYSGYSCWLIDGSSELGFNYWGYYSKDVSGQASHWYFYPVPICGESPAVPPPPPKCKCVGDQCTQQSCLFNSTGMAATPIDGKCGGNCTGEAGPGAGEPVAVISGQQLVDRKDISLDAGTWSLSLAPHFSSKYQAHTVHGFGWNSILTMRLFRKETGGYTVRDAHGETDDFSGVGTASYPATIPIRDGSRSATDLIVMSANGPFEYRTGERHYFFGTDGALDSITDGNGFGFRFLYDSIAGAKALQPIKGISTTAQPSTFRAVVTRDYRVHEIQNLRASNYALSFQYDTAGYLDSLWDHTGRGIRYHYDHDSTLQIGRLVRVDGLDGAVLYAYEDGAFPRHLTKWNTNPIATNANQTLELSQSLVTVYQNTWSTDGRVETQSAGARSFTWTVLKNEAKSSTTADRSCNERKTVVQQTIKTVGKPDFTETLTDTAAACVPKVWNSEEEVPVYITGRQWTSGSDKEVDYGSGNQENRPSAFVTLNEFPDKRTRFSRDTLGQDTLTIEVSKTGDADTIMTHRIYNSEGKVIRETRSKRFWNAGGHMALNDSVTTSTDFDGAGRVLQELRWNNPADSIQGTTLQKAFTYNADGTIASETDAYAQTITYTYTGSTFPGKPSAKVWPGLVNRLYSYDALGRLATETDPRSGVTKHWYTSAGHDSITITPALDTTYSTWQGGRLVHQIQNRKGAGTGREYAWKHNLDGLDTATYLVSDADTILQERKTRDAFGRIIATGDALKAERFQTEYDTLGYPIADTTAVNATEKLVTRKHLDKMGRMQSQILANGDSTAYTLDGWGNKLATRKFIKTESNYVQVSVDSSTYGYDNQVLVRLDSLNQIDWEKTIFSYDMRQNIKRTIGPRLDTTLYGYKDGKRQWMRDVVSKWTWYVTDARGLDSITVTLAKGHAPDTASGTYNIQDGDYVQHLTHDNSGNLRRMRQGQWQSGYTKAEDLPLMRATGYYPSNRVQSDSVPVDVAGNKWLVASYQWYPTGELKKTSRTGGSVTEMRYNAKGQIIAELALNSLGILDTTKVYSYLANGWLNEERTPGLGSTVRTLDDVGRVTSITDSSLVTTRLALDALGRVIADTNGLGYVAKHAYGPNADTLYDRNSFKNVVTRDPIGRTISIKDNEGNQTKLFYELKVDGSERDSVAYPDGTWEVTVTDKGGRTIQKIDKRGVTQTYVYGNDWDIDTLRYEQSGNPTLAITYKRNTQGKTTSVERIEGGVVKTRAAYGYDLAGRVVADTQTVNGVSRITTRTFDDANRFVTLTLPNGTTTTRHADVEGRLASVDMDGNAIATLGYNGNIQATTTYGNGLVGSVGHDLAGRPTGTKWNDASANLLIGDTLAWDVAGRLKASVRMDAATQSQTYGMDNEGQLKEWKTGTPNASNEILTPVDSLGWAMDSRGNWTNLLSKKSTIDTRIFNGANEILTRNGTALSYSDAGQMLTDGQGRTFTWTLDGMLESMSLPNGNQVSYQYDSHKRLAARTEKNSLGAVMNSERYTWSGWQITQEERSNGETRNFAFGDYVDNAFAVKVTGGATPGTFYYHRALNYTVNAITNASGAIVEGYKVQPYGSYTVVLPGADGKLGTADDIAQASSSIGNDRVWQGLQYDNGMYLVRHRVMHTGLGVWLSKDPAKADWNDYRVMGGMPMSATDAWGLLSKPVQTPKGNVTVQFYDWPLFNQDGHLRTGAQIATGWVPKDGLNDCEKCDGIRFKQKVKRASQGRCAETAPYWDDKDKGSCEAHKGHWYLSEYPSYPENGFADSPNMNYTGDDFWLAETIIFCEKNGKFSQIGSFLWGYKNSGGKYEYGFYDSTTNGFSP